MTTHWQEGDVLVSRSYNGLDCTPFDLLDANLMDDNGYYDVIIYFPRDEWETCTDEDEQLELINDYTFHDWCIESATWEEAEDDADAEPNEIAIAAHIKPDLED